MITYYKILKMFKSKELKPLKLGILKFIRNSNGNIVEDVEDLEYNEDSDNENYDDKSFDENEAISIFNNKKKK
jgi:hypothetical protein